MLSFGVNDVDGTIDDSTRIYSMAGSEEQHPAMSTEELVALIRQAGRTPVERDTLYNVVRDFAEAPAS
jgi:aminodeoxyfutalosine synthase